MRFYKLKTGILLSVLFFGSVFYSFAQNSNVSSVLSELDKAFAEGSSAAVSNVLSANVNSSSYSIFESYTLKKTRQLIVENELELARQTALAVIDNNIENFDAVELYSYIDRAILNEEAARIAEENRLRLEKERIAALNARTKERIERSGAYQNVVTASGETVYFSETDKAYSPINWSIQIGIVDFLYQTVTEPEFYQSLKYGLALGTDIFYVTDRFILGVDAFADFQLLTMGIGEQEFMVSGRIVPEIAFTEFSRNFVLRAGFAAFAVPGHVESTGSVGTFATPLVGIGFENVSLGSADFDFFYDYCLGHFAYENILSSMEFGASIAFPLAVNDRTKISLQLGLNDLLFIKDSGIDNRIRGIFAIEVGNVNR